MTVQTVRSKAADTRAASERQWWEREYVAFCAGLGIQADSDTADRMYRCWASPAAAAYATQAEGSNRGAA